MIFLLHRLALSQIALLTAAFALVLYSVTLAPTFGWGDSADLALRMVYEGDRTFTGTHRDYVLYRAAGGLFQHLPLGDVGTRANFMTAFFGAVSVGLVAFLTGLVTRSNLAALCAGLALTVSHTFWLMSVVAEVYTFNAALVLAVFTLTALWWQRGDVRFLYGASLFIGLALLHHATGLVLGATIAPLVFARVRTLGAFRLVVAVAIAGAASLPYWLHAASLFHAGYPPLVALGLSSPSNPFFAAAPLHALGKFAAYVVYNFMGAALLLALLGMVQALRHRAWELLPLALWMLAFIYAGVSSSIPDTFNIYVLLYPVVAVAVGIGVAALEPCYFMRHVRVAALVVSLVMVPPSGYLAAIKTSEHFTLDLVGARQIPGFRDNRWYFMWPGKRGEDGPRRFAENIFDTLPKDAVLIADYSLWRPLLALQVSEHLREDVQLVWAEPLTWNGKTIAKYIGALPCKTPVYLASDTPPEYYQRDALTRQFTLTREGGVVRVGRRCPMVF